MKVSDYIVDFLIRRGVTDTFGYPGGSVANLMNSFYDRRDCIAAHLTYHEQGAAFAACGYACESAMPGVAYATGGPGATNMITAIGHAYYDSIPVILFTGNVNTYEAKRPGEKIRQKAFQESDNISVIKPLVKYCAYVDKPEKIRYCLEKAYYYAMNGRKGPVLLDLPMDVQRGMVEPEELEGFVPEVDNKWFSSSDFEAIIRRALQNSSAPVLLLGNGIKSSNLRTKALQVVDRLKIPFVTSMLAIDAVNGPNPYDYGFLGAYGERRANWITAKSDLLISIGSRLDNRQVGAVRSNFCPNAKIIRVDFDKEELSYKVHNDELGIYMRVEDALDVLSTIPIEKDFSHWISVCNEICEKLKGIDDRYPNQLIRKISRMIPEDTVITTDVGQNQCWVSQSFEKKNYQHFQYSGGMGSMGHALPAAIGAYYGSGGKKVYCICGDGGLQMNIQELQFLKREQIPVKIVVLNNNGLGMIRQFQEIYFDKHYFQTRPSGGYTSPDFASVAKGYGIDACVVESLEDIDSCREALSNDKPFLVELRIEEDTNAVPKLIFGNPNQDQEPLIDRSLYKELMELS